MIRCSDTRHTSEGSASPSQSSSALQGQIKTHSRCRKSKDSPDGGAPRECLEPDRGARCIVHPEVQQEAAHCGNDHEGRHRKALEPEGRHAAVKGSICTITDSKSSAQCDREGRHRKALEPEWRHTAMQTALVTRVLCYRLPVATLRQPLVMPRSFQHESARRDQSVVNPQATPVDGAKRQAACVQRRDGASKVKA